MTTVPFEAAALVIVDMQTQYVGEIQEGNELLELLSSVRSRARAAGVPVLHTQYREEGFGPADHGWELALAVSDPDIVIEKCSADGFLDTDLDDQLRRLGTTTVVVAGYSTEYCVDSTVRSALSHGYDVVVIADGHATAADGGYLDPNAIVTHHNHVFATIAYAGRRCTVLPARTIEF